MNQYQLSTGRYPFLWENLCDILPDSDRQVCSKFSHGVYTPRGVNIIVTSSYYPDDNGGVERVTHIMAQMLVMVV